MKRPSAWPWLASAIRRGRPHGGPAFARRLVLDFFEKIWSPGPDLADIDGLMTADFRVTSAGMVIEGRDAFQRWVARTHLAIGALTHQPVEVFTDATGSRVVARWVARGVNRGVFGLPADGRPVAFTGIAIWRIRDGRLAECWIERSAFELLQELMDAEPHKPCDEI